MIKRIFSDMDGTLLNSKGHLTDTNAQLIRKASIPMTLVSARAPMEMREAIDGLGLTGPQVAFNGGLIFEMKKDGVHPLHIDTIKQERANQLLQEINQHFPQVSTSYYDLAHWYCATIDEGIRYEYDLTRCPPTQLKVENFLKAPLNTFKIMLITFEEETMQALIQHLNNLRLTDVSIQRSGAYYLEITSKAAKKSQGLAYILKKEGLSPSETAAFGDGHNDLPMFSMVGTSIAMDNANPEVKSQAKHITRSNDQDGVGWGIKKYLTKGTLWSLFEI